MDRERKKGKEGKEKGNRRKGEVENKNKLARLGPDGRLLNPLFCTIRRAHLETTLKFINHNQSLIALIVRID